MAVSFGASAMQGSEEEWLLQSPLHVAAYTGDVNKLEALLGEGEFYVRSSRMTKSHSARPLALR